MFADSGTITKTGSVPSNVAVNVEGNLVANFYQDRNRNCRCKNRRFYYFNYNR